MTANKTIQQFRSHFPALTGKTYMNFGAQGVLSTQALTAIFESYNKVQTEGPLSTKIFHWMLEQVQQTKEQLAEEFSAPAKGFALTQSTTDGCNIVLWGTNWQPGDHLLLGDSEHPGVVAAALQVAKRMKLELEFCSTAGPAEQKISAIVNSLKPRTRLVVLSHILWNTGEVMPIEEIVAQCSARNVRVLIDGAQSAGVMPVNLAGIKADYYAITGHKWIGGPEGIGALFVSDAALKELEPTFVGWRGIKYDEKGEFAGWDTGASRFEVSTAPFPLLSGFRAAMQLNARHMSTIERYGTILHNANRLKSQIGSIKGVTCLQPDQAQSGLVTFSLAGISNKKLCSELEARSIIVRTLPKPDCIRASIHHFTSQAELDTLSTTLADIMTSAQN